jgi:hypothetical protein
VRSNWVQLADRYDCRRTPRFGLAFAALAAAAAAAASASRSAIIQGTRVRSRRPTKTSGQASFEVVRQAGLFYCWPISDDRGHHPHTTLLQRMQNGTVDEGG